MKFHLPRMVFSITLLAFTMAALAQTKGDVKVKIYVGPQTRNGFVDIDSGIQDSIKDVQDELRKSKSFTVVNNVDEAELVLLVVGRRSIEEGATGVSTGGSTIGGVKQPTVTKMTPKYHRAVDTILRVGKYEKPILSEEDTWRGAANQAVKDVTVWVEANRERLRQ
jgi:hypothetical protein